MLTKTYFSVVIYETEFGNLNKQLIMGRPEVERFAHPYGKKDTSS